MKKRITALLLCLVMAFSLIPTTVWAADSGISTQALDTGHKIDVTFQVLYVDDSFNIGYSYGKSEKTQFVCQYKTNHSDTAYNNHTIAISDIKAAADRATVNEGYTIVGWSKDGNANPTIWGFNLTTPTACNKGTTIYLVAKDSTPKPVKPDAPSDEQISVIPEPVKVDCVTPNKDHGALFRPFIRGTWTRGADVYESNGEYYFDVTITDPVPYVNEYNNGSINGVSLAGHTYTETGSSLTVKLKYNAADGTWQRSQQALVNCVCEEEPSTPEKPNDGDVENLLTKNIRVVDDTNLHATKNYKLKNVANSFTVGEVAVKDDQYICPVTIKFQPFVEKYSKDVNKTHTLIKDSATEIVVNLVATYDKESSTWTWAAATTDNLYATIHVECVVPAAPTADVIAKAGKVRVICNTNDKHETKVYDLIPGTYTTIGISELTGKPVESEVIYDEDYKQFVFDIYILNKDEYGADSVDGIAPYVDKYNKEFGAHAVVDTVTMCTLAYNEESGAWELLKGMVLDPDTDEAVLDEYYGAARISVQCVNDPTAEDLKELGVNVNVDCKKSKHAAKDYDLTGDETLTVTKKEENGVWTATVSLSKDSAKAFLKQYSKDIGKSHTKLLTNGTIDLVFEDGVWTLADAEKNVLKLTTNCSTSGGGSTTTPDDGGKKVESGKTFDAGIAMYVGLSILSVTGGALVIGKKKEF